MVGNVETASTDSIGSALSWLEAMLLGTIATTVAIIAVASIGFLMLTGRTDLRRGARVILGCFILFGASSIAAGLHLAANGWAASDTPVADPPRPYYVPPPPSPYPEAPPTAYDPYA